MARKPKNTKGNTSPDTPPTRDLNAAMRAQLAIKLRLESGLTWEEVAAQAGYASRGACHNAVMRELDRSITHDVKQLRDQELYMICQLQARCYKAGLDKANDYWNFSVDRFVALSKRKSELMGLDTPVDSATLANVTIIREVPAGLLGSQPEGTP